jgi:hypothetical protein
MTNRIQYVRCHAKGSDEVQEYIRWVQPLDMVDKSVNLLRTYFKLFFSPLDSPDRPSHPGVRPIRLLRRHVHRPLQHMRAQLHLTFMALKRKPAARGKRAPHAPSVWITNIITSKSIPHRSRANRRFSKSRDFSEKSLLYQVASKGNQGQSIKPNPSSSGFVRLPAVSIPAGISITIGPG